MKHLSIVTIATVVLVACGSSRRADAGIRTRAAYRSASVSVSTSVSVAPSGAPPAGSWHGEYYDTTWGMPVAVLVPPRPRTQTNYGWGIGGNTVTPVQPQFQRMEPPPSEYRRAGFQSRPPWPSNTNQFGDYYIRGPW
jgi:hypothetical protein